MPPFSLDFFVPMIVLMMVAAFTPGPNNIMLAASGANFGFRRTLPHMLGITVGFFLLTLMVGHGLEWIFGVSPLIRQGFRVSALAFIMWLAWRIATTTSRAKAEGASRPQYFIEAAGFQFINPKAIAMSTTVVSSFIRPEEDFYSQFVLLMGCFSVITALSVVTWAGFGVMISGLINTPKRLRVFNRTMAVLLVVSMWPVFVDMVG